MSQFITDVIGGATIKASEAYNTFNEILVITKKCIGNVRTFVLGHFLFLTIAAFSIFISILYPNAKDFLSDIVSTGSITVSILATGLSNSYDPTTISNFPYISRPLLENEILSIINNPKLHGGYYVMYGAKGIGKSSLIDLAVMKRIGVYRVDVSDVSSKDDLLLNIARLNKVPYPFGATLQEFKESLGLAAKKNERPVTMIFEIEISNRLTSATIGVVRSLAKAFVWNAHVIIVLSEAIAVLEFGKDPYRENFLYVDEMSVTEAALLLRDNFSEDEMHNIFTTIGTNPAMLNQLSEYVPKAKTLEVFVEDVLAQAKMDLVAFPHKQILVELKNNLSTGVLPEIFNNQKHEGVDLSNPFDVRTSMKSSNAIIYRIELGQYVLMSTAHKTALESYNIPYP